MASPKSLVFQLHKNWEVIEHLTRLSRELPAFEEAQVLAVIARHASLAEQQEPEATLRSLCAADVLQLLPRSSDLQLNPLVLEFVRGLTREHELGLSAVLQARVEAIREATQQLHDGVEQQETEQMRRGAARLSDLFRQIIQQLDQDRHAILELAEKAKASDASMPITRRYRAVLEAYDQYVEPMNKMMDSGLGGTFYPHLSAAERTLDRAVEKLSVRGALYSHRLQLRQVAYQCKELRRLGRIVAQQCADTLFPLREEARQHNALSAAVSELLGRVRKQGLKTALASRSLDSPLPGWRRERRTRIQLGDEILTLMAEAHQFQPQVRTFPEAVAGDPADLSSWINEQLLRQQLAAALPVDNLLVWLQQHYPQVPDTVLLRLYHDLVREPGWQAQLLPNQARTDLQQVRVTYHPHQLTPLEPSSQDARS